MLTVTPTPLNRHGGQATHTKKKMSSCKMTITMPQ